jgi:DNA-binding transcriptional ArsR family regulator
MSDASIVEAVDPDEAFALLGNETRLAILRELWAADGHEATFSDVREAPLTRVQAVDSEGVGPRTRPACGGGDPPRATRHSRSSSTTR